VSVEDSEKGRMVGSMPIREEGGSSYLRQPGLIVPEKGGGARAQNTRTSLSHLPQVGTSGRPCFINVHPSPSCFSA
jgi:hypothetical protein